MNLNYLIVLVLVAEALGSCRRCFPRDFLWGAATSSYQIEGAWNTSGKGENIWDWFTHTYPEKISDNSNGDVACDSYNQYEEDVRLLENLGVNFYRFSLSWSRILPDGTINKVNQEGVNYYLNLLKSLKAKNIEPVVTIYHWDLPLPLHKLGGWINPLMADYFTDYATLCYTLFGEYVKYWITLNEPISQCYFGYGAGTHSPGYNQSGTMTYQCAYTQLLAHAKAYRSYNTSFKVTYNGQVGIVLVGYWYEPLTDSEADRTAAENGVQWALGLFGHPIFNGNWPQVIIDRLGTLSAAQGFNKSRLPAFTQDEISLIKGTYDYLGFNYYTTFLASPLPNVEQIENTTISYAVDRNVLTGYNASWPQAGTTTFFDVPEGIRAMLNWIADNFGNPRILITENGWPEHSKTLNDVDRIRYIEGHLCNLLRAKYVDGVNVFGYTHWSLIDNFEWGSGYSEGFGLVSVDFSSPNRTRTPKRSYHSYRNIIRSKCLNRCVFK